MSDVLIIKGSPKAKGNTSLLADEFGHGAADAGHHVKEFFLRDMKIGDCLGCGACQRNGGYCVQNDDMNEIYEEMKKADVIVLASPVYFFTWTATMKKMIDRTYAVEKILKDKTFYLISAGAAPEEHYMKTMIDSYTQYVSCFRAGGNENGGIVFALGAAAPGAVREMAVMDTAYEAGRLACSRQ